jgi:prolyl-tRNA editing enzyme YbaK/EbsC (Cys-tRNA(Pro) deacylase)
MNEQAFQQICALFESGDVNYSVYRHPECRTSEESAAARKEAGMPEAIGAKALLCKVDFKFPSVIPNPTSGSLNKGSQDPSIRNSEFVVFVLPGTHTLDKAKLKTALPDLKQFRFSTKEELYDIAGVVPGCMPPFGSQIFEKVQRLYVSSALKGFPRVAFNAAKLDTSITLTTEDYFASIIPDKVFDFSSRK